MPPMNQPPMMQPPMEPEPADASRRGKPKRRRFNFNVLENLEKMVQAKQAEPAPQTGWTPPPAPIPPAAQTPPVSPVTASAPTAPAPIPALTPSPETATVAPKPAETAPMLPFLFGGPKPTESAKDASAPAAELKAPEESAENETVAEESTAPEAETTASNDVSEPVEVASEPVAEETSDTGQSSRRSMRSMMFGEEITDAGDKPAVEPEPASIDESDGSSSGSATAPVLETEAPSSAESESSWPSYPWERRQDAGATSETEEPTADAVHETTGEEETPAEPEAWKSSEELATASTSESDWSASNESAPDAVPAEPAVAEVTETTSASDSSSATSDTPERGKPSAGTLVIIEDDQTTASYYSTLFRGNGYEVEVASDGVSGVDLCARVQPQVILLDVMMPRQNGILVLQTLRASDETKNTPVVVMSNFSEPTLIKRALQLGALEYVIKTQVEGPALLNALPRWMNREKAFAAA
jgi:CheY-like chemotaxis protein